LARRQASAASTSRAEYVRQPLSVFVGRMIPAASRYRIVGALSPVRCKKLVVPSLSTTITVSIFDRGEILAESVAQRTATFLPPTPLRRFLQRNTPLLEASIPLCGSD
jgi:hypothetical protein